MQKTYANEKSGTGITNMERVKETRRIHVNAGRLWKATGDFGSVGQWHPLLRNVKSEGNAAGALRIAHGTDGSEQWERLEEYDAGARRYRYAMEKTTLPVRDYHGEFRVSEEGNEKSLVEWSAQFRVTGTDGGASEKCRHF